MRCELVRARQQRGISVSSMADGAIGIIVGSRGGKYNDLVVQRVGRDLNELGQPNKLETHWAGVCGRSPNSIPNFRVELVEDGDSIVFHNN